MSMGASPEFAVFLAWIAEDCASMGRKRRVRRLLRTVARLEGWASGPVAMRSPADVTLAAEGAELLKRSLPKLIR